MPDMQTIVAWCVSPSVTHLCPAKTYEQIKFLFAAETLGAHGTLY